MLQRLAQNLDTKSLFEDYPRLTEADVKVCLACARTLVEEEKGFPLEIGNAEHSHASYEISA